jgi:hypothetical protein
MFGTIGRLHPRPGTEHDMRALTDEWAMTIREKIPGVVVQLQGRPSERPDELVLVVLMQDEETYRNLAAMPEQDAWFRRMRECLTDDPVWDDVAWDFFGADRFGG